MELQLIITVTLNTAVDKTYTVPNFALDRVHRPTHYKIVPGGKGINVARVLHELEMDTLAMGFAGGIHGEYIEEGLQQEQIAHDLVQTSQESRVCTTILDPEHQTQTEINEAGPTVTESELAELDERLRNRLSGARGLVLSGSIPPGVPTDIYASWVTAARRAGVWTMLDSSGCALAEGLRAKPDFAKPNARELAELVGAELFTTDETLAAALGLVREGIGTVLVSMGRSGAIATDGHQSWHAKSPDIDFVSAVGSGDAFVAGFLYGRHHGLELAEALRYGTAAGAANAMTFGAGFCSKECIRSLAAQIELRRLQEEPAIT